MSLPKTLAAYADLDPVLNAAIEHGGLRIPRRSLPPSKRNDGKALARAENFRFRFYAFRRLLAQHGDPRSPLADSFFFEIDPLGDVILRPRTILDGVTTLTGEPVDISQETTRSLTDDITAEAAALRLSLIDEDD